MKTMAAAGGLPLLVAGLLVGLHWCCGRLSRRPDDGKADDVWVLEIGSPMRVLLTITDARRGKIVGQSSVSYADSSSTCVADEGGFDHELAAGIEDAFRRMRLESAPRAIVAVVDKALSALALCDVVSAAMKARGIIMDGNDGASDGSCYHVEVVHRSVAQCAGCASRFLQPGKAMKDISTHAVLEFGAGTTRGVMFAVRNVRGEAAPEVELLPREFSCGVMPPSGSGAVDAFLRDSLEPLVSEMVRHVDERGLPGPPVFALVGRGAADPAVARLMNAHHFSFWLPERSLDMDGGLSLVACGAMSIAASRISSPRRSFAAVSSGQSMVSPFGDVLRQLMRRQLASHPMSPRSSLYSISSAESVTPWGSFKQRHSTRNSARTTPREVPHKEEMGM